jgi:hypothetical protein
MLHVVPPHHDCDVQTYEHFAHLPSAIDAWSYSEFTMKHHFS